MCQHAAMLANGPMCACCPTWTTTTFFWTSGEDGILRILRCNACGFHIHPPGPVCPQCLSRDLTPQVVSGRGRVETFSVNYQQWIPGSDPYVIAWVSLDEQPDVRLTTNLVDVEPDDVHIGMEVAVEFEQIEDVYIPLFRPVEEPVVSPAPVEEPLERRAVISGIGQSQIGRRLGRSDLDLTVEAALAAIADAGLQPRGHRRPLDLSRHGSGHARLRRPATPEVQDALGLSLNWHDGGGEGPGQMRAVIAASLAVAAGLARHVLVYRTVTEGTAQGPGAGRVSAARAAGAVAACPASAASSSGRSPTAPSRRPTGSPWSASGACTSSA